MTAVAEREAVEIRPNEGQQEAFLHSQADVVVYGGAAGGGKSYGLLLEPIRHHRNPHFGAVIFRRTYPQIKAEGGLWDDAADLYPELGAIPNETDLVYRFPSGMTVKFAHMQYPKDRLAWKGAQIPLIGFDQLEDFEESQFWYLLSRNRSAKAGIRPYVRATCNPVPDDDPVGGWLHKLVGWWIDDETGYAIDERSGVVRWFARVNDDLVWADSESELMAEYGHAGVVPKSMTFIPARLDDNPPLLDADPGYKANLLAMPRVERERLLKGNWKIRPQAGLVFDRADFKAVSAIPADVTRWVRYWDKAGTPDDPSAAWSAGVLMGVRPNKTVVVADVVRGQWSAENRETVILQAAQADAKLDQPVQTWVEQEPGSGGKESAESTVRNLSGHDVHSERATGSKLSRARPLAAQVEARNVYYLDAPWSEKYLSEMHRFDGKTKPMDQVDASSGAFNKLTLGAGPMRKIKVVT